MVFGNFIAEGRLRFGSSIIAEVPLGFNLGKKTHCGRCAALITHLEAALLQ